MKTTLATLTCTLVFSLAASADFEKDSFETPNGNVLRYALLTPAELEEGKTYPLVVTLHGVGGRGKETWTGNCSANAVLASPPMRKKFPCFVMAPTTGKGETWWSTWKLRGKPRLSDLFAAIDHLLENHPVDRKRIYVTGQSMGGFGTFGAIFQRPDFFAAAVPVCGGHDPGNAPRIARIPLWIFHGANDTTVPPKWSRDMVAALEEAGGTPKYTEFPNVGHGAWKPAYDTPELWEWLFSQRREE